MDTTAIQLNAVGLAIAAAAGLLSFVSPCVLPLLPAYLGYIVGESATTPARSPVDYRSSLMSAMAFVLGLATVFTLLGASVSLLGGLLLDYRTVVSKFAGAVEKTKPGQKVEVVVLRKGKKETLRGVELPKAAPRDRRPEGAFELRFPDKEFKIPDVRRFKIPDPAKGFEKMSVAINDDKFTIDATKDDTRYRLTGTVEGGKAAPSQIRIGESPNCRY